MFREMRRIRQQLGQDQCDEILANARRGVLAVQGDDGYPYCLPINFVYDPERGEHGAIYMHCALSGHKIDALAACDKVSFTCMDEGERHEGEWWYYVNSVICFGRARLMDDPQRKHDALFALARKYFPPEIDIEADIAKNGARVNMVEITLEHVTGKHVQEK